MSEFSRSLASLPPALQEARRCLRRAACVRRQRVHGIAHSSAGINAPISDVSISVLLSLLPLDTLMRMCPLWLSFPAMRACVCHFSLPLPSGFSHERSRLYRRRRWREQGSVSRQWQLPEFARVSVEPTHTINRKSLDSIEYFTWHGMACFTSHGVTSVHTC